MSLYHLIQAKIFDTYEEWWLKCSSMNRHGFHIVGIENELKSMRDGYNMFVEIRPPQARPANFLYFYFVFYIYICSYLV